MNGKKAWLKAFNKRSMVKIVLTGAESTGKSVLSQHLAKHYNALVIPELARTYIENLNRHYTYKDVEEIARLQIEKEQGINSNESMVFFDTWLIITKVWLDFVFGKSPDWLKHHILASKIDLFLVCDIDIPWEPDPVRENGGETRKLLQQIYINELRSFGFTYEIVSGKGIGRTQNAINIVDRFLSASR